MVRTGSDVVRLDAYGRYFSGDIRSGAAWSGPDFQYGAEVEVGF
jgi:hypothetical protein